MSGTAAPRCKVIGWFDLVTLNGDSGRHGHEQRGVVARRMPGPGNTVGVRRADGTMFTADPDALSVVDRTEFRRGSIVALLSDRGGQIGVVTGASTALDLVRFEFEDDDDGHGRRRGRARPQPGAVVSPESEEVRRVTELVLGEYVVSGAWLGRVVEVSLDADVVFDDGALCRLSTGAERKLVGAGAQAKEHDDYDDMWCGRQTNSVLYPGQRVVGCSPSVFRQESRWIRGHWKPSRVRGGTVSRVGAAGVLVHWVASKHLGIQAPSAWQPDPGKLTRFPYPTEETSAWHVGDRCFFRTPRLGTAGTVVDDHHHGQRPTRRHRHGKRRANLDLQAEQKTSLELERPMSVAGTRTTVDVLWQDGTRQRGLPSRSLVFFVARNDDYDFFPGQHVVSRAAAGERRRSGIVRGLNCRDKTVLVSWFKPMATTRPGPAGSMATEVMSAYDLAPDLDANFFYGDLVLRLQHPNPAETTVADKDDDLSWVGHVVDLCCDDGHVQVKWGDGNTSKVLPHEIAPVKLQMVRDMIREIGDWLYEDEQEEARSSSSSVAAAHQQQPAVAIAGSSDGDSESDMEEDDPAFPLMTTTTIMERVRSVARALNRLAGDLFAHAKARYRAGAVAVAEESAASPEPPAAMEDVTVETGTPMSRADSDGSTSSSTGKVKTSDDGKPLPFPQFDVVRSPSDHHFLDSIKQGTAVGKKWTKRVQKEWKILDQDLPDTIYARAFEDRTDLLRVVMLGASGTPYHDGLFFFDLHLPPSYPGEPPQVSYRSFGLRVNPNLYPSGTMCLSLLNTFGGQGAEELWSPESSTILQVVVSIQGLVLTAQPYYNEPAHGAQPGTPAGLRNELPYSENTYLLSLQTMIHLLRRPPAGFEEFVRDHFRRRGQRVIRACAAYQDGCAVGTLDDEGNPIPTESGDRRRPCSAGFRLALRNVLPRLVDAFASIGDDRHGC